MALRRCALLLFAIPGLASEASTEHASTTHAAPAPGPAPAPAHAPAPAPAPEHEASHAAPAHGPAPAPTPAPRESIGNLIKTTLYEQVNGDNQWLVTAGAFVFGAATCFKGEDTFRYLVLTAAGIVCGLLAKGSEQVAHQDWNPIFLEIIAVEVFLLVIFVGYKSEDGVKLIVGALSGFFAFGALLDKIQEQFPSSELKGNQWFEVPGLTVFVLLGVYVFYSHVWKHALVHISPILGGMFMTSSIWFCMTSAAIELVARDPELDIRPSCGSMDGCRWLSFVNFIQPGSSMETIGVWPGVPHLDRSLARGLWFLFVVLGVWLQRRALKKEQENEKNAPTEGLEDHLLR